MRGFARTFDELFDAQVFTNIKRKMANRSQGSGQGLGQGQTQGLHPSPSALSLQVCHFPGTSSKPIKLRWPSEWQHVVDQMGHIEYGLLPPETKLALLDWLTYEMISCSVTHTHLSAILKEKWERERERVKSNPRSTTSDEYVPVPSTSRRKSIASNAAAASVGTSSVAVAVSSSATGGGGSGLTLSLNPSASAGVAVNPLTTAGSGPSPGASAVAPTHLRLGEPPFLRTNISPQFPL